uniref:Retrovirus-related Pol polyprotein from transposon TNT 1-94 n=1 Tax=Cajanus cajan TaxID=3821 RepID=A0A151TGS8_CAJCA|nr:Retrovirus-related Pol polyprotein from transposon TNT 1-94 [Cajanus cajan]
MEAYLEGLDLWEAVEEDYDVSALPDNPTVAQMKIHKEKKIKKAKAKSCLFACISQNIFTRIMTLKSAKAIWDYLKEEYTGDERIRSMQVLNLMREFEIQRMKETETIKQYLDKLFGIANKVRILGTQFLDSRIVEKILVTILERYEASIAALENTKDLSKITLAEVLHALQALEQRRLMREERSMEGVYLAKWKNKNSGKKKKNELLDVKCDNCEKLGHLKHVCKSHEQQEEANIAKDFVEDQQEEEEEELLSMSCFMTKKPSKAWIIDSGCTNHMTYDRELFKELNKTDISKVQMGNGEHLAVKGKGTLAIKSHSGFKLISDVLYVPDINQNLLSVSQLLGKGYKVLFEDKNYVIKDIPNKEVFNVHMKGKSFALNLEKEEPIINEDTSEAHKDAYFQKKFDDQEENEDDEKPPSKEVMTDFETQIR